jgi:hypothetical protein
VVASASILVAVGGCGGDDDAASDELLGQIDELETDNAALRQKVDELEAENAEMHASLDAADAGAPVSAPSTSEGSSSTSSEESVVATSVVGSTVDEPAGESSYLVGTLDATLPAGESDSVSVIAVGPIRSSTPVVARNNTSEPVTIHLTATARDPAGNLVGSGEDQGVEPPRVGPGEIAIGYVFLGIDKVPRGTTIEVTATGDEVDEEFGGLPATITEHNLVEGEFDQKVVGIARNENEVRIEGPISVLVLCFDKSGNPLSTDSGFTDVDALDPGQDGSFSVDLYSGRACPQYLVGASGYSF